MNEPLRLTVVCPAPAEPVSWCGPDDHDGGYSVGNLNLAGLGGAATHSPVLDIGHALESQW